MIVHHIVEMAWGSYNTIKILVSMSPVCHLNFVPKFYTGSVNGKEIVRQSGFLDFIMPGDAIMADKGFNIQDLLQSKVQTS